MSCLVSCSVEIALPRFNRAGEPRLSTCSTKLTPPLSICRLVESGGDWDRRNRLKAYTGLHLLSVRNFKKGAELLLDTLSTFTATELMSFDDFVKLCIISGTMTLERKELKKKVRRLILP